MLLLLLDVPNNQVEKTFVMCFVCKTCKHHILDHSITCKNEKLPVKFDNFLIRLRGERDDRYFNAERCLVTFERATIFLEAFEISQLTGKGCERCEEINQTRKMIRQLKSWFGNAASPKCTVHKVPTVNGEKRSFYGRMVKFEIDENTGRYTIIFSLFKREDDVEALNRQYTITGFAGEWDFSLVKMGTTCNDKCIRHENKSCWMHSLK